MEIRNGSSALNLLSSLSLNDFGKSGRLPRVTMKQLGIFSVCVRVAALSLLVGCQDGIKQYPIAVSTKSIKTETGAIEGKGTPKETPTGSAPTSISATSSTSSSGQLDQTTRIDQQSGSVVPSTDPQKNPSPSPSQSESIEEMGPPTSLAGDSSVGSGLSASKPEKSGSTSSSESAQTLLATDLNGPSSARDDRGNGSDATGSTAPTVAVNLCLQSNEIRGEPSPFVGPSPFRGMVFDLVTGKFSGFLGGDSPENQLLGMSIFSKNIRELNQTQPSGSCRIVKGSRGSLGAEHFEIKDIGFTLSLNSTSLQNSYGGAILFDYTSDHQLMVGGKIIAPELSDREAQKNFCSRDGFKATTKKIGDLIVQAWKTASESKKAEIFENTDQLLRVRVINFNGRNANLVYSFIGDTKSGIRAIEILKY